MIRIFINPPTSQSLLSSAGGIDRVVYAQHEYLQEFGIEIASNLDSADVIANHATHCEERSGTPMVSHCHGMYWSGYEWPGWTDDANSKVIEAMRRATAVTAPSQWVRDAMTRGMLIDPTVIYHGVDTNIWTPDDNMGYVLWNKGREDSISNPKYMQELARRVSGIPFVSTFGVPTSNVRVIGVLEHQKMMRLVQRAGIYLQTTRETFGISTIEALSCGVPVVGWDFGGQHEIITQGETGYLAPYGDYDTLEEYLYRAIDERDRLSSNCRNDAESRWQWRDKIGQYAELYQQVLRDSRVQRPRVSVIITSHNLARFLADCIRSVIDQTVKDWEIIVVDDHSNDNPREIVESIADSRLQCIRTRENVGLSNARNIGFSKSRGRYIIFLDADDMLDRGTLEILADALDRDSSIHIAYGSLDTVNEEGNNRRNNDWPGDGFDWRAQISHLNQLSYASMMRREVMDRSGGYRERDWRAEDASFWTRVTSFGFRAKKVTDRPTLIYRFRHDSKSSQESKQFLDRDGDWTRWFPWRTGAENGRDGEEVYYKNTRPNQNLVPFGAQGSPRPPNRSWPVHHYAEPVVSIIIPVAKSHQRYLIDALDSCLAQTIVNWEAIVIDDSSDSSIPEVIKTHSFAKVFYSQGTGTSRARNIGAMHAHGKFLLFLDADDILDPCALEEMLREYTRSEGYIYSDCKVPDDPKRLDSTYQVFEAQDYDQDYFIRSGYSDGMPGCHSVTFLLSVADFKKTDGFDESLAYWEDWQLPLQLAALGIRGTRIAKPLLTYRLHTGIRRQASKSQEGIIKEALRKQFEPYTTGEKEMCACNGGHGGNGSKIAAIGALASLEEQITGDTERPTERFVRNGKVRLHYIGDKEAPVPYRGQFSRKIYMAGRDPVSQYIDVEENDAPGLMRTGQFDIIDTVLIEGRLV